MPRAALYYFPVDVADGGRSALTGIKDSNDQRSSSLCLIVRLLSRGCLLLALDNCPNVE
jgi:hypothetical protein